MAEAHPLQPAGPLLHRLQTGPPYPPRIYHKKAPSKRIAARLSGFSMRAQNTGKLLLCIIESLFHLNPPIPYFPGVWSSQCLSAHPPRTPDIGTQKSCAPNALRPPLTPLTSRPGPPIPPRSHSQSRVRLTIIPPRRGRGRTGAPSVCLHVLPTYITPSFARDPEPDLGDNPPVSGSYPPFPLRHHTAGYGQLQRSAMSWPDWPIREPTSLTRPERSLTHATHTAAFPL